MTPSAVDIIPVDLSKGVVDWWTDTPLLHSLHSMTYRLSVLVNLFPFTYFGSDRIYYLYVDVVYLKLNTENMHT